MSGSDDAAEKARQLEAQRQFRVARGMVDVNKAFSGFTPDFYQNRVHQYESFAMPQLGNQFQQVHKQVDYDLANRHLVDSSAAQKAESSLQGEYATQKQGIVDTGISQAQDLQRQVEAQRQGLVTQLQVAQNPSDVANQAITAATSFAAPTPVQPIGNLFNNWATIYAANKLGSAYNSPGGYYGGYNGGYGGGGFNFGGGSNPPVSRFIN